MRRISLYILAFFLLPFYPFLPKTGKIGDKIKFGERVIVVTRKGNKKKVYIT